jgi:hypothetical protein
MLRKAVPPALAFSLILFALARYFSRLPHVFDLALDDEAVYMGAGTDFFHKILWPPGYDGLYSSYEDGGLYAGLYGLLSVFFSDPIDLYIYGGTLIVAAAVICGGAAIYCLSGSTLVAVLIAGPVILSGELTTWPRVSFAAIAAIAFGLSAAAAAPSLRIKTALLLCAAYLAAFIRPEFVLSFYLLLALQIGLLLRRPRSVTGADGIASGLALLFVAAMSALWSFPVIQGGERAFVAFGAHYAVRFAATHPLAIDPWIDWRTVIAAEFPGAETVFQASLAAPDKMLGYIAENIEELAVATVQVLGTTVRRHVPFAVLWVLAAALWLGTSARRERWPAPRAEFWLALVFAAPPLIATITIFPRHHYIVLLLFALSAAAAAALRPVRSPLAPVLALAVAIGVAASAAPLPAVPQPLLATVLKLREQTGLHRMFEIDGGWCYFMVPRCVEDYAGWQPDSAPFAAYRQARAIDAIMLSPRLLGYEAVHHEDFARDVAALTTDSGWRSIDLGGGYTLLRAAD